MHIFEAYNITDILNFIKETKPSYWELDTRKSIDVLHKIYVLRWME